MGRISNIIELNKIDVHQHHPIMKSKNYIQIDKFPEQFNLDAEQLALDAPGILDFTIADTIVIALMEHPDCLLQAYSLKNLKPLGILLKKGKGPDEFQQVSLPKQLVIDSDGIKMWVLDPQLHTFFLLNITETIKQKRTVIDKKYDLTHLSFTHGWIYKNDALWGMQWTMDNLDLISYNADRDTILYNSGPLFEIAPNVARHIHIFSHDRVVKPDLSKIVINMLYLNQLQIISLVNPTDRFSFSTAQKPIAFDQINKQAAESVTYYRDVRVTNQLIFASFYDVPTKAQMD